MNNSDLTVKIIAALNKQLSKKQIKNDLKTMDNSMYVKVISKLSKTLSQRQLKKDLKQLTNLYVQIGANVNVDKNARNQLQKRIKALGNSIAAIDIGLKVSKSKGNSDVSSAQKAVQAKADQTPVTFDIEVKRNKAIADVENLGKRFSKLFTNVSATQKYENILMSAHSISDDTQLNSVRNQIAAFTSELKENGFASQSLSDKWKGLIAKCKELFSATNIVTAIFTQVRQAASTFLQLDTAMTDLYRAQDQITGRDQFSELLNKWNKSAQSLAVTTESLIHSASEWSKMGFDLDISEQLAEITSIFEKTTGLSKEKATSTLISTAQAFPEIDNFGVNDYVKSVETIGNKINAISGKYNINSEEIADSLQNTSTELKAAGNDLNETIALITAANKLYQNPSEASNMLKVASLRLDGQVDALEKLGEDTEGVSTDLDKIRQQIYQLTGYKVNIFEDEEHLKSTYKIVLEIGKVFSSLNDRQQADLLEIMFGEKHASAGISLLLNYEELEQVKSDSMNAADSMIEEYSKYMESAEAHITIFKEKLIETYSTFMSGDMIKYTADIGSGILDLLNATDLLKHSILAILALNIGKGVSAVGAAIVSTSKQMNILGNALQQVRDLPFEDELKTKSLIEIGEKTQNLTEKNLKLVLSQKNLGEQDKILILRQYNLSEAEAKAKLEKMGLITATNAQSAANIAETATTATLKGALLSLKSSIVGVGASIKAAFLSNPIGVALTVITTTISIATTVISKCNEKLENQKKTLEKQKEKLTETKEAYENVTTALKEVTEELGNIQDRIKELESISHPTLVEQEELDRLHEVTTELKLQKQLKQDEQLDAAQTLYQDNKETFNEEFKGSNGNSSVLGLKEQLSSGDISVIQLDYENNITDALAALQFLNEEKEKLTDKGEIAEYDLLIDEITNSLKSNIESNGLEYLSTISEYKQNILELADIRDLTEDEQSFYDYLSSIQKSIYEFYDPATWNNLKFESIFDTDDIEVTKEKLIEMYQSGKLSSEETLKQFPKLSNAIKESELIAGEGSDVFKEFYNEIAASAEASEKAADGTNKMSKAFSKPAMIDSVNALSDGFDTIRRVYSDIQDGGTFDFSLLDSKNFKETFSGLDAQYNAFIGKVASSPNDIEGCRNAFNSLIGKWLESKGILENLTHENAQVTASMLQNMGVANAQELVYGYLNAETDALALKEQLLTETGGGLKTVTSDKVLAFLEQAGASETARNYLIKLIAEEQVFSNQDLDVSGKITKLKELAENYGQTALAAKIAAQETTYEESDTGETWSEADLQEFQKQWNEKLNSVTIDFSPESPTSKNPKNTGRAEKDIRLEEYRQKLEELQTMLDWELINERDFYEQSDALLNDYLKDTPAHMQKYADEISNAEKTLRGNWIGSFGYEKAQLEKDLSDSTLVRWQYYEQLSELAEQYYNTEGASYGKFADEYEEITREIKEGQEKLWDDIFSEVNSQLDSLQSACETVRDAVEEYSENGSLSIDTMQKLIALEPQYMSMLFDENGQLQLNAEAYGRLAKTKLEELKIDLAGQALNTINSLQSEAQAVELLTGKYAELRDTSAGAIEQQLRDAVAEAYGRGEKQGQAAETVLQAYISQKKMLDATDLSSLSITAQPKDDGADRFLKTFDWIGTLLKKISEKTSKLVDKADKFYNWQKKNSIINRAVKSTDREISQNERAYQTYMKKANSVGLSAAYVNKIQNGTLSIQDITNESLSNKIDKYQEWYDKAQGCLATIEDLYDKQRDLIRQKLDNVLDYYSDLDSYLSSVTSKIESLISLNDEMGKRSSLTELVEQFSKLSDQLESVTDKETGGVTVTEGSLGDSKKVAEAKEHDRQELVDSIQAEINDLKDIKKTGTYQRLLDNIEKKKEDIDKYESEGWDKSKAKSYQKLQKELQNYYDLQKALDENATSDTIANYEKIYIKYQELQNKINDGRSLSDTDKKKYKAYVEQLDALKAQGTSAIDKLYDESAKADGTAAKQSESDRLKDEISSIQSELENTATYQKLIQDIREKESEFAQKNYAGLDEQGFEKLSKKKQNEYKKMQKQLEDYYEQKKALDEGATASNIAEYNKMYLAWKELQDKIDNGITLSSKKWIEYNDYTKQLEKFKDEKSLIISELNDALEEAENPSDKLGQIKKAYEESAKGIYDSYQKQIDSINSSIENTTEYKKIKAEINRLEAKKNNKKKNFTISDQTELNKYNAELEAMQMGATGENIKQYKSIWEEWYKLDLEKKKNGTLKGEKSEKYDTYTAQLKAWNAEKQTQINDLLSLMEDDLEQLQKTYTENVSEAESQISEYYANLYSLAKQIAEYNLTTLQAQLDKLDAYISYYKEIVSLYDSFDGDKLVKILTDLGEISADDEISSRLDLYTGYLDNLQKKYDATLSEINEYSQLLDALDTKDFEKSMDVFNKAIESYKTSGDTAMADRLQSVIDLLNERAVDAGNWGEFADEWENEWEEALSSVKQDLIGTATEIQDVNDALREIRFENITNAVDELEKASGILSSIENLIKDEWLFEPDGTLSEYGRAKAALLVSQLEDAQSKADEYLKLYNEIQDNKDTYASDKAYKADLNEALQNYYDSLGSAASLENSIMDLMKKNAEEEINSLKDIIEARKKALQAKKAYYDYDKSIRNSQKEIDSLKAQIDALEGLSDAADAATKAKLAQLKAELADKEDALQETKDEHTFNLQIDALDEFAESLTDALDSSSKSVEEILKEQKEIVSSAKELSRASTDSTNKAIGMLTAFYRGMGTTIDGIDPVPDTDAAGDSATGISLGTVNVPTDTISKFVAETSEALKTGVLVRTGDAQLLKVFDENMLNYLQANFPPVFNDVQPIPNYIDIISEREMPPAVVNNYHYDCLLNVEGNVDKNALPDLQTILISASEYTKNDLYHEQRIISNAMKVFR